MSRDVFQLLSTCPRCRVEGALVELVEPGSDAGRVLEASCKLCGRREEMGEILEPGLVFRTHEEVLVALRRWAAEEGEEDVELFSSTNFDGLGTAELAVELIAGKPIVTCFDAVAWLFPGSVSGAGIAGQGENPEERAKQLAVQEQLARRRADRDDPALVAARALIAVMVGDGKIRPEERQFIDQCMQQFGYPPISEFDIRPWRPSEIGRPADPYALVEAMARLVYVDRERDGSEWRIVREFARYWGYPMEKLELLEQELDQEYASKIKRLWTSVRRIFVKEQTW